MSLVADYDSDSNSSASSGENDHILIKTEMKTKPESSDDDKKLPLPVFKLPTPQFSLHNEMKDAENASVFINPFLEAENAKEAILQKHVKMVNSKSAAVINGKKICWNYRKGRCRFGHNCKYAHDSDLQKSQEQISAELDIAKAQSVVCQYKGSSSSCMGINSNHQPPQKEFREIQVQSKIAQSKKKKRPGLTQGLVPGKKVMAQYLHNKN